jgi:hypothetical protein
MGAHRSVTHIYATSDIARTGDPPVFIPEYS